MKETNRSLTVVALMLGLFLAAMEMTVVSTAMPTVVSELGGLHLYAWAFTAYMLTATVTVPIYGKLADLYGRKPILLAGIGLFLAGSFACGHADSMTMLIWFRALQGLGAGALQTITLTIVGDLFDLRERGRMQGLFAAVWGVAGLTGPLIGGLIVHLFSWRWIFYLNVPFCLGAAAILSFSYREHHEHHPHKLDWLGALLLSASVLTFLVAFRSREVGMVALPLAAILSVSFVAVQQRASEPLLPLDLFKQRVIAMASVTGTLMGASMVSMVTFVPLWVQSVLGESPTAAGAAIAPMAVGWPIASVISGRVLHRVGYRPLVRGGLLVTAAAGIGLALNLSPGVPLWLVQVLTFACGLGLGFASTPLIIAIQVSVPWNRRGVATASSMFFRTIGGTLAVGTLGSVLAHALTSGGANPAIVEQLLGPGRSLLSVATLSALAGVLQSAMGIVFWSIAIIASAAFTASLAFPELPERTIPQPDLQTDGGK